MLSTRQSVVEVLSGVDDPEYSGVSIVDLGLVERVSVDQGAGVTVELVPTFTGCPALDLIADDVRQVLRAHGEQHPTVRFVDAPVWTPERISATGRAALRRQFTVAVKLGERQPPCPRCGAGALSTTSLFGSMRCRSVATCAACGERTEMIR